MRRSLVRSQVEEPPNPVAFLALSPAIAVGLFAFWGSVLGKSGGWYRGGPGAVWGQRPLLSLGRWYGRKGRVRADLLPIARTISK